MSSRPSAYQLTSPGPLRLYSTVELLNLPSPEWLIEPVIPMGGLCCLYGESGLGKSFVALDMACSIASGASWHGMPAQEGYCIYISAEGGRGMGKRALAWSTYHETPARDIQVAWLVEPIPVYPDSEQMDRLLERIAEIDRRPTLLVIDTLARCFDGDENTQLDMGRFVNGCDILRHQFETTVLIVHHTRLGGDRERGNTALRAATDTMLELSREGAMMALDCNKQKDAEEFPRLLFRLDKVPGTHSCVSVLSGGRPRPVKVTEADLLAVLLDNGPMDADTWRSHVPAVSRTTFYRVLSKLDGTAITRYSDGTYEALANPVPPEKED